MLKSGAASRKHCTAHVSFENGGDGGDIGGDNGGGGGVGGGGEGEMKSRALLTVPVSVAPGISEAKLLA